MVVFCPKGMFGCILNYGKLPYFDPNFRTGFRVGKKGNFSMCHAGKLYPH